MATGTTTRTRTATAARTDLLRALEAEFGVLTRRIRRVIAERAHKVHPDLQGSSYLMLGWLQSHGPQRASAMAEAFAVDKGAISRQVQHLVELGLVDRTPDPDDGRASLVSASGEAVSRLSAVAEERRRFIDERLGDWTDGDLESFVRLLGRYNVALDER